MTRSNDTGDRVLENGTGFSLDFDNGLLDLPDFVVSGSTIATEADFQQYLLDSENAANPALTLMGEIRVLVKAYDTVFGREPDLLGFDFWINAFRDLRDNDNAVEDDVADILGFYFSASSEYQALYPPGTTNERFLTDLYFNQFNRAPDQAGFDFWLGLLNDGTIDRNDTIAFFITSPEYELQEGDRIDDYVRDLVNQNLPNFTSGGDYRDDENALAPQWDDNAISVLPADEVFPYLDEYLALASSRTEPFILSQELGVPQSVIDLFDFEPSLFQKSVSSGLSLFDYYGVEEGDIDALRDVAPPEVFEAPVPMLKPRHEVARILEKRDVLVPDNDPQSDELSFATVQLTTFDGTPRSVTPVEFATPQESGPDVRSLFEVGDLIQFETIA